MLDNRQKFDWNAEWKIWRRNFKALQQLAEVRDEKRKLLSLRLSDAVEGVLAQVRYAFVSNTPADGIRLWLTCKDGSWAVRHRDTGYPDDLTTLWQAAFLSYFQPGLVGWASVCQVCGEPLPRTKKFGKQSRQRFCPSCRTRHWRKEKPDKAREQWRTPKRRQRAQ